MTVSDWHGQLEPFPLEVDGHRRLVGGAAVLATYFRGERQRNPGGTLVMAAGDSFGATPALSSFLEDVPAVEAQNAMGFVNSGGLRDDLPSSYQPADRRLRRPAAGYAAGPPWDVVEADLHAVFPFHNVAVTFRVTGRALWEALEHGVGTGSVIGGRFTNAFGGFPQISGFRFDPRRRPGERVLAVTWPDGTPIPRDGREYTAVTSDFVYNGGDGYAMLRSAPGTTRELIAAVVGRALREPPPAAARIEGRITEETR